MKKKIMILAGIMVMALATVIGVVPVSARTKEEAISACESISSWMNNGLANSTTVKCVLGSPESSACSAQGGTFTGKQGDDYVCLIPFSNSSSGGSSGGSSSSISEEIKRQREACEAKGGTYSASVSGGYVSGRCSTDIQNNTTLPDGGSDGSGNSDNGSDGSGGVTWNTDNSSAQATNPCGNGVMTNLFGGCVGGDSDGNGVFTVLNVILNVLTWGIGIAGTLGIVITGIQYMTAKDDVAQMAKAKNRLIQIVIGLAIYAVMWAFLQWLLPGGVFGNG